MHDRKRTFSLLVIVLMGLLIYSNIYGAPFVLDDIRGISSNPDITSFHNFFLSANHERMFGFLTLTINYELGGLHSVGYHLFNITVHLINAVLVFFLVLAAFRTPFLKKFAVTGGSRAFLIAVFSGLVFVAHPLQTEAVTYTIQRFASLATLFYLLTILLYARWRTSPAESSDGLIAAAETGRAGKFYYVASLAAAVLAMGSKETAFTLPAVLVMWEFFFYFGPRLKRLLRLLPFAATSMLIPLTIFLSGKPLFSGGGASSPPPALDYLLTQFRVIVTYIRLLLFPAGQNLDYDYPVYHSLLNPNVFLSLILLLTIVMAAAYLVHRSRQKEAGQLRLIAFGIFFFFISLSVESSVIPISDVIFEHRVYLPSAGFIIAAVTAVVFLATALSKRVPAAGKLLIPALILVVAALGTATYARNSVWGSARSLWSDAVAKSPGKARPHINLGLAYEQHFMINPAQRELEKAVSIHADAPTLFELGMLYEFERRLPQAMATLTRSLELSPGSPNIHYGIGNVYLDEGKIEEAKNEYLTAVSEKPNDAQFLNSLGTAMAMEGDLAGATSNFEQSIKADPGFALAYNNLGLADQKQGKLDDAAVNFAAAIRHQPGYADAFFNLGKNCELQRRFDDAAQMFLQAIKFDTGNYRAHAELGNVYRQQNKPGQAEAEYEAALQIKPGYQVAASGLQELKPPAPGS
ncbi:MAG: tetratricopeptide repeat protein [Actinobacteria bacterium]|nr:tetratricopeptide repeat protein [Actinomycetota bacterium]